MLVWLNGNQNVKGKPNENYGREMMELFTLGANRGAYTETDVREQARALTGWQGSVVNRQSTGFTFNPRGTTPARRRSSARPATSAGRTRASSASTTRCTLVLRRRSCGATSSRRRRTARRRRRCRRCTRAGKVLPVVEAILAAPGLLQRARAWSSRRSCSTPACCACAAATSTRRRGGRSSAQAGQQLFYPPDVGGWDDTRWLDTATFRARWFIAAVVQGADTPTDTPSDPAKISQRAIQFWGKPDGHARRRRRCCSRSRAAQLKRERDARRRRDRAAPARRLLPRPPDRMSQSMSCYDCNRADLFRRAVAQAGEGLPEIEPGMPIPAGTGLTRREFVSRTAGLALAVYGGAALSRQGVRRRHRAGGLRRRRRSRRCSSPSSSTAASTGCTCSSLPATRSTTRCARTSRSRRRPDARSPRTTGCAGIRPRTGSPTLHDEGKVSVHAGGRLRQLEPVAFHVAPLLRGRRHRCEPAHRLARPLPRPRRHAGQPAAGPDARRRDAPVDRDREGAGRDAHGRRPVHRSRRRACRRIRSRRRSSRRPRTSAPRTRSRPIRAWRRPASIAYDSHHLYYGLGSVATASTAPSPTRPRPIRSRIGSPDSRRCSRRAAGAASSG